MFLLTTGFLIAGACLLLGVFSVVSQAMEQKRTEKRLAIAGLQRQVAQYQNLINNFPPGYLNKELEAFLSRCVIDICEKLEQLSAGSARTQLQKHRQNQKDRAQVSEIPQDRNPFKTAQQIKEIKQSLKELLSVVAAAVQRNGITLVQANQFKQYLSGIMLTVNLDSYQMAAVQAEQTDKLQVAIHYHEQAKKLILSSNLGDKKIKIEEYDRLIKALNQKLTQQASSLIVRTIEKTSEQAAGAGLKSSPHLVINDESDPTKKKQIYD